MLFECHITYPRDNLPRSEPEQATEPVKNMDDDSYNHVPLKPAFIVQATYKSTGNLKPPKREPLNFDQLQSVMSSHFGAHDLTDDEKDSAEAFARAIERAHGIGDE